MPNSCLFTVDRFLVDLRGIVNPPVPAILFVCVTGQVGLIWHDKNMQNPFFIMHKVQELSTEIHVRTFILFFLFVGSCNWYRWNLKSSWKILWRHLLDVCTPTVCHLSWMFGSAALLLPFVVLCDANGMSRANRFIHYITMNTEIVNLL